MAGHTAWQVAGGGSRDVAYIIIADGKGLLLENVFFIIILLMMPSGGGQAVPVVEARRKWCE